MLTQCPNCQTIYQISAGELGAAKGFVECGDCGVQFNALDRIADEPQFTGRTADVKDLATQSAKSVPTFLVMEEAADSPTEQVENLDTGNTPVPSDLDAHAPVDITEVTEAADTQDLDQSVSDNEEHDKTLELAVLNDEATPETPEPVALSLATSREDQLQTDTNEFKSDGQALEIDTDSSASNASLPPKEHEILFTDPLTDSSAALAEPEEAFAKEASVAEAKIDVNDVPPILQEELLAMQEPRNAGVSVFWLGCAILLLIGLAAQAGWHYKDPLLKRYPAAVPYAERACVVLGCELNQVEALEPIQLVSRDVRTHPRYENALLVNASMVNTGPETISFPTVQLGLFDPTGTAIGIRQFAPQEYLDKSIEIDTGIPPGRSVHVVLELANTSDEASSFEFSFH